MGAIPTDGLTAYPRSCIIRGMNIWEILVPTEMDGRFIPVDYHRRWDKYVRDITGGLTILPPGRGQWVSPFGKLNVERMIPVRIVATKEQMLSIASYTRDHYRQEAVLFYKISDEVYFIS